jgi:hypothetical protein
MLPYLKAKRMSASIMSSHKADGGVVDEPKEEELHPAVMTVAEDILQAISMKDAKRLAEALKSMFSIMDIEEPQAGEMGEI